MTSTTTRTQVIGLGYRDRTWMAWRYPKLEPTAFRAFVAHTRERAIAKACAGLPDSQRVASIYGELKVDVAKAPERARKDPMPEAWRPVKCVLSGSNTKTPPPPKHDPMALGTIHGVFRVDGAQTTVTSRSGEQRKAWPCVCRLCGHHWVKRRGALTEAAKAGDGGRCGKCPDARVSRGERSSLTENAIGSSIRT